MQVSAARRLAYDGKVSRAAQYCCHCNLSDVSACYILLELRTRSARTGAALVLKVI
jgi:hypothetical protein